MKSVFSLSILSMALVVSLSACEDADRKSGAIETPERPTGFNEDNVRNEGANVGATDEHNPEEHDLRRDDDTRYDHPSEAGPGGTNEAPRHDPE